MSLVDIEFWRMPEVIRRTGLSKSEIYRRIDAGTFPAARKYDNSNKRFWVSSDVVAWQQRLLGDEFGVLLG